MPSLANGESLILVLGPYDTVSVTNGTVIGLTTGPVVVTTQTTFGPYVSGSVFRIVGAASNAYTVTRGAAPQSGGVLTASISPSGSQPIGTVFTCAADANFVGTPSYQWKLDSGSGPTSVGTNSANYTSTAAGVVTCVVSGHQITASGATVAAAAATAPAQVTGLTLGIPTSTTQPLTWSVPSDGGSALTDYVIQSSPAGANTWTTFAHAASTATSITVTGLTPSTNMDYRVAAVNAVGQGGYSATATGATTSAAVLRSVAMDNFLNNTTQAVAGKNTLMYYRPFVIGSGDVNGIRVSFSAWRQNPAGAPVNTAGYVVSSCYLNDATETVQSPLITFGGNSTLTVNSGGNDIQSDLVLPSALGLTSFAQGSTVWLKFLLTFAAGADVGASSSLNGNWTGITTTHVQFFYADSAVTTPANVTTAGRWQWTGTTPTAQSNGFAVCLLGTFASGDPQVWLGVGDSILWGYGDAGVAGSIKRGILNRAAWDDGTAARKLAMMNLSVTGATASAFVTDARMLYWAKYCNRAVVEPGTNDFGTSGTALLSTVQGNISSINSTIRTNSSGIKIIGTKLGPRTNSTDAFATEANQTYQGAGWQAGGNVANFNASLSTLGADSVLDFTAWHGVDPWKWATGPLTTDGLHPNSACTTPMATQLRTAMDAT